jgi:hypothetical protein
MPCLRRHGIPGGGAASQAGPQDLPAGLQAVSRQRPHNVGVAGEPELAGEASGMSSA